MIKPQGQVRVSRMVGKQKPKDMKIDGYTNIVCLTKSTKYGSLSPYELKDEYGRCIENLWQFGKCYDKVPSAREIFSRFDQRVIWEWPAQTHVAYGPNGEAILTREYFEWRKAGCNAKDAIRYPVGRKNMSKCLFALAENPDGTVNPKTLDYVESRKAIYLPLYTRLVQGKPQFEDLKRRLINGENLLIIEIDGPHAESIPYYQEKYGAPANWIQQDSILCNKENMTIMLNDHLHPFGHGYCLALALQGIDLLAP
tara:strand:+ start:16187 stop:16951 length:765 start_codon:yes stop_codon:yes gene_type:complete